MSALDIRLGVLAGLFWIAGDVEGETRRFRDGQTVVESDAAGDGTESDDDPPDLVDRLGAVPITDGHALGGR